MGVSAIILLVFLFLPGKFIILPFPAHRKEVLSHPAGTSKDSDICDLSKVSDIEISMEGNGRIYIFKHPAYFSKHIWEIYI